MAVVRLAAPASSLLGVINKDAGTVRYSGTEYLALVLGSLPDILSVVRSWISSKISNRILFIQLNTGYQHGARQQGVPDIR